MKRESNIYTLIYSVVLVLVVGITLSIVYQALKPRQDENIANDKKKQILAAALITPGKGESISQLYDSVIVETLVVNNRGYVIKNADAFNINIAEEVKLPDSKRKLPVYVCKAGEGLKYIVPAYGAGLWGPIWGYIAIDNDGESIYGAYFAHQGETPGLGAEIEKPAFQKQFEGKKLYDDGMFEPIKIVKNGQEPSHGNYVHAISGGTITSQGVQKMLSNSLQPYDAYFKKLQTEANHNNP